MRYPSVDILRGFTVAVMILVNNPGSWSHVHPWLLHAEWNGCSLADLVFPFFIFIVGLSIVFALSKSVEAGIPKSTLAFKCLKRAAILIGMGLFLNAFPEFNIFTLRLPGVLQRIGLVFALASLLYLYCTEIQRRWIGGGILIGYWLLIAFVPVPGLGKPSMEVNQNWPAWVDSIVLEGHMWKYTMTWDPEGILSTFTALVTCLIGISVGIYKKQTLAPVKGLWFIGIGLLLAGLVWSFIFPLNKALWTSSFVLLTAGAATCGLAISTYLFDEKQYTTGTFPFMAFGANPLLAYFGAEFLARVLNLIEIHNFTLPDLAFQRLSAVFNPVLASFLLAVFVVAFWLLITSVLYRKKIFLKI